MSPIGHKLEQVSGRWIKELLGLPNDAVASFVTGATMAAFTALGAARQHLLKIQGLDASADGLFGAPNIRVIVSEETHITNYKALGMLGFGRDRVEKVPVDDQGRMIVADLPDLDETCLILCQAGNVNSGAFDDVGAICDRAQGAWVHVDGAFGLWARTVPELSHMCTGMDRANSWSVDGHKWLNTPYDCGISLVRDAKPLLASLATQAAYLTNAGAIEAKDIGPEFSRRARGIEVWAALRCLGRDGLAEVVHCYCRLARLFAKGLNEMGYSILNEVVLNQVVASVGTREQMQQIQKLVEESGVCWFGTTHWQDQDAFRISVSSWATTDEDVQISLDAIRQATLKVLPRGSFF
jgi:glutamate/tyrosine decarboxylase-like PLP-dependent enzyme